MYSIQTEFTFAFEWLSNFRFLLRIKSDLEPRPFWRITLRVHFNAELIDIRLDVVGFSQRLPTHIETVAKFIWLHSILSIAKIPK